MIHTFSCFFLWTKLHIASNNIVSPFQHYHEFHPFWNLCSYCKLFSRHTPIVCLHAKSIIYSNQIILSNISDFCFLHFGNNVFKVISSIIFSNHTYRTIHKHVKSLYHQYSNTQKCQLKIFWKMLDMTFIEAKCTQSLSKNSKNCQRTLYMYNYVLWMIFLYHVLYECSLVLIYFCLYFWVVWLFGSSNIPISFFFYIYIPFLQFLLKWIK